MLIKMLLAALILASLAGNAAAQENTPEPTVEVTAEVTPEATAESTLPPDALMSFPGPGSYTVRQPYGDIERSYRVYIPGSYRDSDDPVALLVVMHGAGGSGADIELLTGFNDLAEQENFIVVYPDGINSVWNDGRQGDPRISVVDDVRFLDGIVQFMVGTLHIDPQRVYASGYSMGGMMAYRVGCELPNRFAAVASVASTMPAYLIPTCIGTPPIPVMVFQGTDDPVIQWVGIANAYLSAAQTIGFWGNHNTCGGVFVVETLPDAVPEDYTRVIRQQLSDCAADLVLYGIYFGGHTWPGHPFNPSIQLGQTTQDIDATTLIWEFFNSHVNLTGEPAD